MPKILQMQTNSDVIFKEFQKILICRCIIGEVFPIIKYPASLAIKITNCG